MALPPTLWHPRGTSDRGPSFADAGTHGREHHLLTTNLGKAHVFSSQESHSLPARQPSYPLCPAWQPGWHRCPPDPFQASRHFPDSFIFLVLGLALGSGTADLPAAQALVSYLDMAGAMLGCKGWGGGGLWDPSSPSPWFCATISFLNQSSI